MALNDKTINFDINKRNIFNLTAKQYDTDGARSFTFRLIKNSIPFDLEGLSIKVGGKKPDGKNIFNDCVVKDAKKGIIELELTTQMQVVAGTLNLELIILKGETRLSTIPFEVEIIQGATCYSEVQSSDEFGALQNALWKTDNVYDKSEIDNFTWNMSNMGQDVKEAMTGGSVAVVGVDAIDSINIKDNVINDSKIKNITMDKINDIEGVGIPLKASKDFIYENIFTYKDSTIKDNFTIEQNGYLKINKLINGENTIIREQVLINGKRIEIAKLLPYESIKNDIKTVLFEKKNIKDFTFDKSSGISFDNDNTYARAVSIETLDDNYSKNITTSNIFTEDCKFVGKPQTEFASYAGNLIGVHGGTGKIQIKVSKDEVINSGNDWTADGIIKYVDSLENFNIYLRYSESKQQDYKLLIPVNKGDEVDCSNCIFDFYTNKKVNDIIVKTYQAYVKNRTSKDFTDRIIKIKCNFEFGEVKENNFIVRDEKGNVLKAQWEDDFSPNFKTRKNIGRYRDGSLKTGYILLNDSIKSKEIKKYLIEIHTVDIEKENSFLINEDDLQLNISNSDITLNFDKEKKYCLKDIINKENSITNNTGILPFRFNYKKANINNELFEVAKLKDFNIECGEVACIVNIELESDNIEHFIVYKFYINCKIECFYYIKALDKITDVTEIFLRNNVYSSTEPTYYTKNPTAYAFNNVSSQIIFANGDIPRDEGMGYPTFKSVSFGQQIGTTKIYSLICGWQNASDVTISKDMVFSNCINLNLKSLNADIDFIEAFNPVIGVIVEKTLIQNKCEIKSEIVKHIRNINDDLIKNYNPSTQQKLLPSIFAKIVLYKEYEMYSLNEISNDFKSLMKSDFRADFNGIISVEKMLEQYNEGEQVLHFNSRVFPIATYLLKEFKKINNVNEVAFYETTVKNYAEFMCRVFEEKGNTPLYGNKPSLNSNSTASGCKALSDGLKIEENARWRDALNKNVEVLKQYLALENIIREGNNLSNAEYLHYTSYATHGYATCYALDSYIIDFAQYFLMCTNAKGETKDQEFCCSRSRRGLGSTIGYIAYSLLKQNDIITVQACLNTLKTLWEQAKLEGGQKFPLYEFDYLPPQTYETSVPMELQAFCDMYYLLEDMCI